MHDSQRYRYSAREGLLAAKEASQPYYRKLRLSMASSWLSLARQEEAMDEPLVSWASAEPVKIDRLLDSLPFHKSSRGTGNEAVEARRRLAVSDNGIGTSGGHLDLVKATHGLGMIIVEVLAKQLGARVEIVRNPHAARQRRSPTARQIAAGSSG